MSGAHLGCRCSGHSLGDQEQARLEKQGSRLICSQGIRNRQVKKLRSVRDWHIGSHSGYSHRPIGVCMLGTGDKDPDQCH